MQTFPEFEPYFPEECWTLPHVLEEQATRFPDRPYLQWTHNEVPLTYDQVNRKVNRLAHGLAGRGVAKGDRIVIFARNSLDFVLLYLAANKLGAAEAPINTAYKGEFLSHQIRICEASTLVVEGSLLDRVTEVLPELPFVRRIFVWNAPDASSPPHPTLPEGIAIEPFEVLWSEDESNPGVEVRPQDIAAIMFTSGTTGLSKGVLMTQAQVYFFSEECCRLMNLTADDVYLTALPLFHSNPQMLTVNCTMIVGASCVLYERFSPSLWLERVRESGATVTNCVGATAAFIHAQPPTPRDRDHKIRMMLTAPTPWEILDDFKKRFGIRDYAECFGQTEINLPFMVPPGADRPEGSIGVEVAQFYDIRLVDPETDREVPVGTVGELVVRPKLPWILNQGYVNMPDKTAQAFRNLWFHTGDAMKRDANGWYYFVDRYKDTLRRRGENISSFEVETQIRKHPAIADVAVVAVPAEFAAGEDEVKAVVVLNPTVPYTHADLIAWCDARMPYFAVPRYVDVMETLPISASEKVQKHKLRDAGITTSTWDRVAEGVKLNKELERKER